MGVFGCVCGGGVRVGVDMCERDTAMCPRSLFPAKQMFLPVSPRPAGEGNDLISSLAWSHDQCSHDMCCAGDPAGVRRHLSGCG